MKEKKSIKNKRSIIIIGMFISALLGAGMILYINNQSKQFNFDNYNIVPLESSSSARIQVENLRYCKIKYENLVKESNLDPKSPEGLECVFGDYSFDPGNIYYCYRENDSDEMGILTKISKTEWIEDCINWKNKQANQ